MFANLFRVFPVANSEVESCSFLLVLEPFDSTNLLNIDDNYVSVSPIGHQPTLSIVPMTIIETKRIVREYSTALLPHIDDPYVIVELDGADRLTSIKEENVGRFEDFLGLTTIHDICVNICVYICICVYVLSARCGHKVKAAP